MRNTQNRKPSRRLKAAAARRWPEAERWLAAPSMAKAMTALTAQATELWEALLAGSASFSTSKFGQRRCDRRVG